MKINKIESQFPTHDGYTAYPNKHENLKVIKDNNYICDRG